VTLAQTGCQSGPFGACGPCGGAGDRLRGLSERMFRPLRNLAGGIGCGSCGGSGCDSCGTVLGAEAPPIQYGAPAVVTPAAPLGTGPALPPPTELTPAGPPESPPSAIPEPASPSTGSAPSGARSNGTTGKVNFEAMRPKFRLGRSRSDGVTSTVAPSPEPTFRSAQGPSASVAAEEHAPAAAPETNPLDNLPPLEIPRDVTRAEPSPPAPTVVARDTSKPPAPAPTPAVASPSGSGPAPEAETLVDLAAKTTGDLAVAPGIRRFAGVEPKLAGGSVPTAAGLDWLVEKGYKTILDLREESELALAPTFMADVTRRGLRYIALPVNVRSIDADLVERFNFEVSLSGARPLFFCDADGNRAGAMWYIRRVTVDKVDPQTARKDAEEVGLTDPKFQLAADGYLASIKPAPAAAPAPAPAPKPAPAPAAPSPAPANPSTPATGANAPEAPSAGPAPAGAAAATSPGHAALLREVVSPSSWKPLAAVVVTGLGVPLAFLSRSVIPATVRSLTTASLPGPSRSRTSRPDGSDG
jgi:protein tyrosine phosphatase (PTP) superfamily phosphohydrolase (DUF442 family)